MEKSLIDKRKEDISYNLSVIRERIQKAAELSGRKADDITLLGVTKTVAPELINHAVSLGVNRIGENKVQEYMSKYDSLDLEHCTVDIIGHLQTNKVKYIIGKVKMIQSVDSIKLANEISSRSLAENIVTDVLVEVNIGKEEAKSGIDAEKCQELIYEISELKGISLKGLMTIPPICDRIEDTREFFYNMHKLFIDIKGKKIDNIDMQYLSMGMSSDYYEAVLEGANIVRVGTSLFGPRIY